MNAYKCAYSAKIKNCKASTTTHTGTVVVNAENEIDAALIIIDYYREQSAKRISIKSVKELPNTEYLNHTVKAELDSSVLGCFPSDSEILRKASIALANLESEQ